jgi:hypothetical protein
MMSIGDVAKMMRYEVGLIRTGEVGFMGIGEVGGGGSYP